MPRPGRGPCASRARGFSLLSPLGRLVGGTSCGVVWAAGSCQLAAHRFAVPPLAVTPVDDRLPASHLRGVVLPLLPSSTPSRPCYTVGVSFSLPYRRRPSRRPYGPPIMGATSRTLFSLAFLVVAATSSLLLTWSIWWLATVGTSVPARRPFFLPGETPPTLIAAASESSASPTPVFQYSLAGGWPAAASGLRVAASGVGVVGALTYALLGTYARAGVARAAIGGGLGAVTGLAAASAVVDGIAIGRARSECADRACVTALPPGVGDNGEFCVCDVGAFFWITLGTDVALAVGAAVGAAVTLGGVVKRGQRA